MNDRPPRDPHKADGVEHEKGSEDNSTDRGRTSTPASSEGGRKESQSGGTGRCGYISFRLEATSSRRRGSRPLGHRWFQLLGLGFGCESDTVIFAVMHSSCSDA